MTKNVFAYGDQRISPIYRYCTVFTQLFDYSGPLALSEIGKSAIDFGFAGHMWQDYLQESKCRRMTLRATIRLNMFIVAQCFNVATKRF